MNGSTAMPHNILWHSIQEPLPDVGKQQSGHARTPFGTMHLIWTSDFLLHIGFEETQPDHAFTSTAQNLADLMLSHSPLPIRPMAIGTPFQLQVWQSLINIPSGATTSYRNIAQAIGSPKASRAVGSAIGANRLALLIPCHRVIRSDGHLGGFRWGIPIKQKILAYEHT